MPVTLVWLHKDDLSKLSFQEKKIAYVGDKEGFFTIKGEEHRRKWIQSLTMVPSASAVVITLREYLGRKH